MCVRPGVLICCAAGGATQGSEAEAEPRMEPECELLADVKSIKETIKSIKEAMLVMQTQSKVDSEERAREREERASERQQASQRESQQQLLLQLLLPLLTQEHKIDVSKAMSFHFHDSISSPLAAPEKVKELAHARAGVIPEPAGIPLTTGSAARTNHAPFSLASPRFSYISQGAQCSDAWCMYAFALAMRRAAKTTKLSHVRWLRARKSCLAYAPNVAAWQMIWRRTRCDSAVRERVLTLVTETVSRGGVF